MTTVKVIDFITKIIIWHIQRQKSNKLMVIISIKY